MHSGTFDSDSNFILRRDLIKVNLIHVHYFPESISDIFYFKVMIKILETLVYIL